MIQVLVIDSETQDPVEGALVFNGNKSSAFTDSSGYASIEAAPGESISVDSVGFDLLTQDIAQGTQAITFPLLRSSGTTYNTVEVVGKRVKKKNIKILFAVLTTAVIFYLIYKWKLIS